MDDLLTLTLIARNPDRNHHRRYQVGVGRDLLGHWTVRVSYGRVGQAGQERRYGGPDEGEMRAVVRRCLARRRSAPGRLGCGYTLVERAAAPGLDPADWLPAGWPAIGPATPSGEPRPSEPTGVAEPSATERLTHRLPG